MRWARNACAKKAFRQQRSVGQERLRQEGLDAATRTGLGKRGLSTSEIKIEWAFADVEITIVSQPNSSSKCAASEIKVQDRGKLRKPTGRQ